MARIVFTLEDGTDIETELGPDVITLGRHHDNHIVLPSVSVSSHHAIIKKRGEDFHIQDLGTTNGTKLNGVEVEEAKLSHGDRVTLGDVPSVVYLTNAPVVKSATSKVATLPPPIAARAIEASKQRNLAPRPGAYPLQYKDGTGCASFFMLLIFLAAAFLAGLCLRYYNDTKGGPVDFLRKILLHDVPAKEQRKLDNKSDKPAATPQPAAP